MSAQLSDYLGETLLLMSQDFHRRLRRDLQHRGVRGIGQRHQSVFLYLSMHGPSRSAELAARAGIRAQSMAQIVRELEQRGLVARRPDPADSRAKLIDFTASGRRLIDELTRSTRQVWREYAAGIGEPALEQTITTLRQLLAGRDHEETGND